IDWAGLDRGFARRKVELPTYPFERQRFPVPKPGRGGQAATGPRHPLAETVVRSPLVKETVIATALSTALFPYLAEHRVLGEVVVPAACYLAMMLNGAARLGQAAARLEEVFFVAPLVLAGCEERAVQAVIDTEGRFQIISLPGEEMVSHVSGRLAEPAGDASGALEEARSRCTRPVDVGALLAGLGGVGFGAGFRWSGAPRVGGGGPRGRRGRPAGGRRAG